jgi:hypothetical protein
MDGMQTYYQWVTSRGMRRADDAVLFLPYFLPPAMESTRIIPLTGTRSGQPSNIIRMEPDPHLIKIDLVAGQEQISGGDAENAQRFSGETRYVSYYAARIAETLGMRRLEVCILEDRDGQTSMLAGQQSGGWRGSIQPVRRSIKQVLESLGR